MLNHLRGHSECLLGGQSRRVILSDAPALDLAVILNASYALFPESSHHRGKDMKVGFSFSTIVLVVITFNSAHPQTSAVKIGVLNDQSLPTDDPLFGKGTIRVDGRKIHPVYLYEVKKPAESKGDWDNFKVLSTIPGDEAFRPLLEGGCPLVKR